MTPKIPELQFDFIARLVPGSAVLGLLFFKNPAPFNSPESVWISFIAAYVVGFSIQNISGLIGDLTVDQLFKHFDRGSRFWLMPSSEIWTYRESTSGRRDFLLLKRIAERSMFQSLALIFTCFAIYAFAKDHNFGDLNWKHIGALAATFTLVFLLQSKYLSNYGASLIRVVFRSGVGEGLAVPCQG